MMDRKSSGKTLIEAMFHEAGLQVPKDLLHNQWINYYDHDEGFDQRYNTGLCTK